MQLDLEHSALGIATQKRILFLQKSLYLQKLRPTKFKYYTVSDKLLFTTLQDTIILLLLHYYVHSHCTGIRTLFAGSSCNDIVTGRGGMGNTIISGHFDKRIRFWDLR